MSDTLDRANAWINKQPDNKTIDISRKVYNALKKIEDKLFIEKGTNIVLFKDREFTKNGIVEYFGMKKLNEDE